MVVKPVFLSSLINNFKVDDIAFHLNDLGGIPIWWQIAIVELKNLPRLYVCLAKFHYLIEWVMLAVVQTSKDYWHHM